MDDGTWLATRPAEEAESLLAEAGLRYERFTATHAGGTPGAVALVRRAWNLDEIAGAYEQFVRELRPVVNAVTDSGTDEEAYSARFRLVHAWRTFLFRDPQLPPQLLPERWAGLAAAAFFDRHAGRLRPAADRYVDGCLELSNRTLLTHHLPRTPIKGVRS
jgi:phenylacetic acid degradation operon negative regulatory protein